MTDAPQRRPIVAIQARLERIEPVPSAKRAVLSEEVSDALDVIWLPSFVQPRKGTTAYSSAYGTIYFFIEAAGAFTAVQFFSGMIGEAAKDAYAAIKKLVVDTVEHHRRYRVTIDVYLVLDMDGEPIALKMPIRLQRAETSDGQVEEIGDAREQLVNHLAEVNKDWPQMEEILRLRGAYDGTHVHLISRHESGWDVFEVHISELNQRAPKNPNSY